jgi:hypothetical protein
MISESSKALADYRQKIRAARGTPGPSLTPESDLLRDERGHVFATEPAAAAEEAGNALRSSQ